jgi:NADH:ubiquinone oxidoreductase subunit 2 (subunit N)
MRRSQPNNRFQLLVALLLMAAVATVLITPDPTDDVHAVMRSITTAHAPAMPVAFACLLVLLVAETLNRRNAVHRGWSNSLQLLCMCRC